MKFIKRIYSHKILFQSFIFTNSAFALAIFFLMSAERVSALLDRQVNYNFLLIYQILIDVCFFIIILLIIKFWKLKFDKNLKIPSLKTVVYILIFTFCSFSYDILLGSYFYEHFFNGKLPVITFGFPFSETTYEKYKLLKMFLFAPIYEELFYRRIVFTKFKERYNFQTAMVLSSLLFAFGHWDFSIHLISFFAIGMILSYIYHKTNSIITIVMLHSFCNIFNSFQKFIEVEFYPENYSYLLYYLGGFVAVYYAFKKLTFPSNKEEGYFYYKGFNINRFFNFK